MKIATRTLLFAATLVGGVFAFRQALAQEPGQDPAQDDMMAMMAEMQKLAAPGDMHKMLANSVGEWDLEFEMFMPGMEPMKSTGHSTIVAVLGGRYIQEQLSGSFMGMPFEGMNMIGYDNHNKVFTSTWFDTSSTWPITATGTWDKTTRTLAMKGVMKDAANMDGRPYRHVTREIDEDHFVSDMYDTIPPVGDVKVMTIVYKRAE